MASGGSKTHLSTVHNFVLTTEQLVNHTKIICNNKHPARLEIVEAILTETDHK